MPIGLFGPDIHVGHFKMLLLQVEADIFYRVGVFVVLQAKAQGDRSGSGLCKCSPEREKNRQAQQALLAECCVHTIAVFYTSFKFRTFLIPYNFLRSLRRRAHGPPGHWVKCRDPGWRYAAFL